MDPHPTPFAGKRRPAPAPAAVKATASKPKSIAATRMTRMAKKSPNAGPQSLPARRAFGTIRTSNAPAEKPPPKLQKSSKVSPPPPPPPQKPVKVSPTPLQKHSKLSPPAIQKTSKLSPPNPARATRPSRTVAKSLKKTAPGADLEAKAKKKNQRVSFQVAAVEPAALGSREKVKATADDVTGHTPMVARKAAEKPSKAVAAETPFFSAQNCSSCTLDQLESAAYWLAQIRLAESVGKHWIAASFFRLAFESQAQPIHRLQSELRNYSVRHESAGTLAPLFDELLTAHGMLVNQPKFDTDGYEKVETPLATNVVDKMFDLATLNEDECLKCVCDDDADDVGVVIVDKHGVESVEYPTFEGKLDESLEFDDSDAVIVDRLVEANFDLQSNANMQVPCSSGTVQAECRSSIKNLSPRGPLVHMNSSSGRLSLENLFDKNSPLSSKRLTSSCPSYKKSVSVRDQSSKRIPSGIPSDGKHNANAAEHQTKFSQHMGSKHPSLVDRFEVTGPLEDASNN